MCEPKSIKNCIAQYLRCKGFNRISGTRINWKTQVAQEIFVYFRVEWASKNARLWNMHSFVPLFYFFFWKKIQYFSFILIDYHRNITQWWFSCQGNVRNKLFHKQVYQPTQPIVRTWRKSCMKNEFSFSRSPFMANVFCFHTANIHICFNSIQYFKLFKKCFASKMM